MFRRFSGAIALLLWPGTLSAQTKVVAYAPNWVDVQAFAETIDYARLTHLNIAFEDPANDSGDLSFSSKNEFLIAKARASKVQILVSIGGGSASGDKTLLKRYSDLLADAIGSQGPGQDGETHPGGRGAAADFSHWQLK